MTNYAIGLAARTTVVVTAIATVATLAARATVATTITFTTLTATVSTLTTGTTVLTATLLIAFGLLLQCTHRQAELTGLLVNLNELDSDLIAPIPVTKTYSANVLSMFNDARINNRIPDSL